ncbi:hypothetical protein J2X63_000657 [Agromyces sp. 3263]|uniref:hypothetical protein n=1 Tax=Agromyces sp. 3263 TaxID=2817750 RepID=UPI00285994B3|nr:hypothetical protein [Agromyces sp. 3263]MDR6904971.1 hypothetical protein [Agromyces sp. 3263]
MRAGPIAAVVLTATLALSACSPQYDDATKADLRAQVIAVSTASAAGDWPTAIAGLDELATDVSKARRDGRLDDQRFAAIVSAMDLVRQDLAAAVAAAETEAEQQRLLAEQARLQEQITQLQADRSKPAPPAPAQGDDGKSEKDGKGGKDGEEGEGEGKSEGSGRGGSGIVPAADHREQ